MDYIAPTNCSSFEIGGRTILIARVLPVLEITFRRHKRRLLMAVDSVTLLAVMTMMAGLLAFLIWGDPSSSSTADFIGPTITARLLWVVLTLSSYILYRLSRDEIHASPWKAGSATIRWENLWSERVTRFMDTFSQYQSQSGLTTAHLFHALLTEREFQLVIVRSELNGKSVRQVVERIIAGPSPDGGIREGVGLSDELISVFAGAAVLAFERKQYSIRIGDLIAALIESPSIKELLKQFPQGADAIQDALEWGELNHNLAKRANVYRRRAHMLPKGPMNITMTSSATPLLDLLSRDITEEAKRRSFRPLLGRDKEFLELFQMIEGQQRHVVLVGPEGTGKQTFFYELAQRIVERSVPAVLDDQRLLSLDPSRLFAGASRTGEVESRLQQLLSEIARARNVILLLEHIEQFVGLSSGSNSMDILDEFLRVIEGSELVVFGTTTIEQWTRTLEQKTAFTSVFHRFDFPEMSFESAQLVLYAHANRLESRFPVVVTTPAIVHAIHGSIKLMHNRSLPEKAIAVLEEASGRASTQKPPLCTAALVDTTLSELTHIPIGATGEGERDLLLHLEDRLKERVVGQLSAVQAVANALRRARSELEERQRPIANLLFVGPTGVGKTFLAKTVASLMYGDAMTMVRLDMSEYQDPQSIQRFLGVPGSMTGGVVTEALREHPFTLLLLDELEKAHPKILTLLLQLMDEGRLTDVTGRTIDATNTLLIATSNAATAEITRLYAEKKSAAEIHELLVSSILPTIFPPEFVNRFDDIIIFEPLDTLQIEAIAAMELDHLKRRLAQKGIEIEFLPQTVSWIARVGFHPQFGARPLRRAIQDHIENSIARGLLEGSIAPGSRLRVLPEGVLETL